MTEKIDLDDIRVRNLPKKTNTDLNNISKNIGITKSELIRKKLREILNEYPDELKSECSKEKKIDVTFKGISPKMKNQFINIATNTGVDLGSLMKVLLKKIADGFPPQMKKPYVD